MKLGLSEYVPDSYQQDQECIVDLSEDRRRLLLGRTEHQVKNCKCDKCKTGGLI